MPQLASRPLAGPLKSVCLLILLLAWCASAAATTQLRPALPDLHGQAHESILPPRITPWIYFTVERGDTLSELFNRVGLAASQWQALLALGGKVAALRHLNPGDEFHLRKTPDGRLAELHFPFAPTKILVVRRTKEGLTANVKHLPSSIRRVLVQGVVGTSLFQSLRRAGTPDRIATALIRVFKGRINLRQAMDSGDRFSIIYLAAFVAGHRAHVGPILAASIHTQGQQYRAFRYVNNDHEVHYYDASGQPIRRGIERTPLNYLYVSSPFDMHRVHPILGVIRPHTGVDLAAPRGTPVHAAADGTVTFMGWKGGYGRMVVIEHGRGYSTRYAHLSGFADTLAEGEHVEKGKTIGFVGASGLATGYHLHFEIRKNGTPHNPLTMELPSVKPLSGQALAAFTEQIQPLIARLNAKQAPLSTLLASNTIFGRTPVCSKTSAVDWLMAVELKQKQASALASLSCPKHR